MNGINGPIHLRLEELELFDPHPVRNGNEWRFRCLLCQGEERTLHLNRDSGLWNCKRASCIASGILLDQNQVGPLSRRERAQAGLQRAFGGAPSQREGTHTLISPVVPVQLPRENVHWKKDLEGLDCLRGTQGQAYGERRGLPVESLIAAGVRFSPSWSWLRHPALVFPVRDNQGVLQGAQGRFIGNVKPKAVSSGSVVRGVYPSPDAWEHPWLTVTEAPLDAISLWYCGFPAIALCGTAERPWLWPHCVFKRVVLGFDADEGGEQATANWRRDLTAYGARCVRIRPEGAKDWNEMLKSCGQDDLNRFLNNKMESV